MNYLEVNKKLWEKRTSAHIHSKFYDVEGFLNGKNILNDIELKLLGDVKGKEILHLQCHFGLDSLALCRLGAKVTGVDFSPSAIEKARELARITKLSGEFILSDIYSIPEVLNKKFDIVFTSYGTIGWLPDLKKWAEVVSGFLKPGGVFVFADFHPVLWMFDDDFNEVAWPYSSTEPVTGVEEGTYADKGAEIHESFICWNHGVGSIVQSLISSGLSITSMEEFDFSPYSCLNNSIEESPGKWRIKKYGSKLPLVLALKAFK